LKRTGSSLIHELNYSRIPARLGRWIPNGKPDPSVAAGPEEGVDLVLEVRLFVPEAGGGGAALPADQRRDAREREPGVHPPRVRRVAPRGLVTHVGAQEHRVPAPQGLQPLVDHRLRHVAICGRRTTNGGEHGELPPGKRILQARVGEFLLPGHQVREEPGSRSARKSSSFTLPSGDAKRRSKWAPKSASVASTFSTVISPPRLVE
jgi:hypothetical protein